MLQDCRVFYKILTVPASETSNVGLPDGHQHDCASQIFVPDTKTERNPAPRFGSSKSRGVEVIADGDDVTVSTPPTERHWLRVGACAAEDRVSDVLAVPTRQPLVEPEPSLERRAVRSWLDYRDDTPRSISVDRRGTGA